MMTASERQGIDGRSVDDQLLSWSEIERDFADGGLLIGNGFSQAVWKKFGYKSIYEAACSSNFVSKPLTPEDKKLFESMKTNNFEQILSRLSETKEVNSTFGREYGYLEGRYEYIKDALGEAVRSVHIPWQKITREAREMIRKELKKYQSIYSTNYDLLPYWSIMLEESKNKGFKDFFWQKYDRNDPNENPYFEISDTEIYDGSTKILYLHGALHIYRDPFTERTHKLKNRGAESLLDIVEVPLFITEGSSEDKMKAIRKSDYLLFAYTQFLNHKGPLVIFGHSLDRTDLHLIKAIRSQIKNQQCCKIAVSIRSTNSPDTIRQRKADLIKLLCEGQKQRPEVVFFDSQTHPLGSKDIRIE